MAQAPGQNQPFVPDSSEPVGRHQTSDDGCSLAPVGYEAGDRIVPSRRPGAGASRLRSAAAVRLERGAVIEAIAVARARRLIAPRPTPVIVAIEVTWGWLTRVMLPGHRDPPVSPLRNFEVALLEFRPVGAAICQPRASPWGGLNMVPGGCPGPPPRRGRNMPAQGNGLEG